MDQYNETPSTDEPVIVNGQETQIFTPNAASPTNPDLIDTPRRRMPVSVWFAAVAVITFAVGLGSGYLLWGRQQAASSKTDERTMAEIITGTGDPVWGPEDAPITIVEFSDYECPYCQKWQTEVWPALQKAYPDQIRLIYRDFPLTGIHQNAVGASLAANCAGDQDKYWEFHEQLFKAENGLGFEAMQGYAEKMGMDTTKFVSCITSDQYLDEVRQDFEDGRDLGINGTPTFFIGTYRLVGAQPLEAFQQVIDAKLNGELD